MAGNEYTLTHVPIVSQNITADKSNVEQPECDNIPGKSEPFFCKLCQLGLSTLRSLKVHLLATHIRQTGVNCHVCNCCKRNFSSSADVMGHIQSEYTTVKVDACFNCGRKFLTQRHVPFTSSQQKKSLEHYCDACPKKIVDYEKNITADKSDVEQSVCDNIAGKSDPFFCKLCLLGFTTFRSLKVHLRDMHVNQTGVKCHICKCCKRKFPSASAIMKHLQSEYTTVKVDACFECGSKFPTPRPVPFTSFHGNKSKEHYCDACQKKLADCKKKEKLKTMNEPFVCKICPDGFFTLSALDIHLEALHIRKTDIKCFTCTCCHKSFQTKMAVLKHMHFEYTAEGIDNCFKCGSKFPKKHFVPIKDYRFVKSLEHYCDVCRQKIEDYEANEKRKAKAVIKITDKVNNIIAKAHQKVLPCKDEERLEDGGFEGKQKLYCCEFCQECFPSSFLFERHLLLTHPEKEPYVCEICEKKFSRKNILIKHCVNHSLNHCCNICEQEFSCKSEMQAHRLLHADNKTDACDKCDKKCKTKQNLPVHSHKLRNKKHVCDVCQKQFYNKSYLHNHRKLHTKIHSCTVCEKKFAKMSQLTFHLKTHTGGKLFLCEICGKGFLQEQQLKSHLQNHTSERPFVC